MGKINILTQLKLLIASIGFRLFIWGNKTTEEDYWNQIYEQERAHLKQGWNDTDDESPLLEDEFTDIEILADTGDYNNLEVVLFDGTNYFDKHRNDEDGNPLEITNKITRWMYI